MRHSVPVIAVVVATLLVACGAPAADSPSGPTPSATGAVASAGPPEDTGVWVLASVEDGKGSVTVLDGDHRKVAYDVEVADPDRWIEAPSVSSVYVTTGAPGPTVRCELWKDGELLSEDQLEVGPNVPDGERYAHCVP